MLATDLPSDAWLAAAGRNLRAGLRKARNRFERRGELTVTTASGPDAVAAAFDEFIAIEATGWKADHRALGEPAQLTERPARFLLAAAPAGLGRRPHAAARRTAGRRPARAPPATRSSC